MYVSVSHSEDRVSCGVFIYTSKDSVPCNLQLLSGVLFDIGAYFISFVLNY